MCDCVHQSSDYLFLRESHRKNAQKFIEDKVNGRGQSFDPFKLEFIDYLIDFSYFMVFSCILFIFSRIYIKLKYY